MSIELGNKIKQLRNQKGFTQSELAKKLGISTSAVGMYEQGRREPDNQTLIRICNFFNVSSDWLISKIQYKEKTGTIEVSDVFNEFTERLMLQQGLMFDGTPLNDDDRLKIIDALKIVAELARQQHKRRVGEDGGIILNNGG